MSDNDHITITTTSTAHDVDETTIGTIAVAVAALAVAACGVVIVTAVIRIGITSTVAPAAVVTASSGGLRTFIRAGPIVVVAATASDAMFVRLQAASTVIGIGILSTAITTIAIRGAIIFTAAMLRTHLAVPHPVLWALPWASGWP